METEFKLTITKDGPYSPREREVLERKANGSYRDEIARDLGISVHTVRNELVSAFDKTESAFGERPTHGNWIGLLVRKGVMTIEVQEGGV